MRLDHIAYRVANRNKTADFFIKAFNYSIQTEFELSFEDGSKAKCIALEPSERLKTTPDVFEFIETISPTVVKNNCEYHIPPEIFVSDGTEDSIVGKWVAARNNVGGIHHLAYQVDCVRTIVEEWKSKGFAEFATEDVLTCPDLVQIFTKPSELTGVIFEFIERGKFGFCKDNVKSLMESTKDYT